MLSDKFVCLSVRSDILTLYGPEWTTPVLGVFYKTRLKPVSLAKGTRKKIEILLVANLYNDTFRKVNNKGTDLSGLMCRLVCAFVVCKH